MSCKSNGSRRFFDYWNSDPVTFAINPIAVEEFTFKLVEDVFAPIKVLLLPIVNLNNNYQYIHENARFEINKK